MSNCLSCNKQIEVNMNFDTLGDTIVCPHCNYKMEIGYDEYWFEMENGDMELDGYFYLESG